MQESRYNQEMERRFSDAVLFKTDPEALILEFMQILHAEVACTCIARWTLDIGNERAVRQETLTTQSDQIHLDCAESAAFAYHCLVSKTPHIEYDGDSLEWLHQSNFHASALVLNLKSNDQSPTATGHGVLIGFSIQPICISEHLKIRLAEMAAGIATCLDRLHNLRYLQHQGIALDISGDQSYVVDVETLRYIDVNDAMIETSGYSREELLTMTPSDLVGSDRKSVGAWYADLVESGEMRVYENTARGRNGGYARLELHERAVNLGERWSVIGTSRDVSARYQAERKAARSTQMYATLSSVNEAIMQAQAADILFEDTCEAIVRIREVLGVAVVIENARSDDLILIAGDGVLPSASLSENENTYPCSLATSTLEWEVAHEALLTAQPVVRNGLHSGLDVNPYDAEQLPKTAQSIAAVPLSRAHEPFATLLIRSTRPRLFNEEIVSLLCHLADNVIFGLDKIVLAEKQKEAEAKLKEHVEELEAANSAALAAARSKAEFLANMSHEIRTPMNGVLGMLDLLNTTALSPEQKECVDTAVRSGKGLLGLINDILDLSKIEAGKMQINTEPSCPASVVEDVLSILYTQVDTSTVELSSVLSPAFYDTYHLDAGRLRQILLNLVGNAIKFTHNGTIFVDGEIINSESQSHLKLSVKDTGIGMSASALKHLFEAFTQADSSTTRRYGGTGLGLTITRQLIELMGGAIDCTSSEGEGSTFEFHFPVTSEPQSSAYENGKKHKVAICTPSNRISSAFACMLDALGQTIVDDPEKADIRIEYLDDQTDIVVSGVSGIETRVLKQPLKLSQLAVALDHDSGHRTDDHLELEPLPKAKVLIAEDNTVNQMVARRMLERLGVECQVAPDGSQVLQLLRTEQFDLILMDCQMPTMDGYEATESLRKMESTHNLARIPIIALTANAMASDMERCLSVGMDDYLSKPIDHNRLHATLLKWLPNT